MFSLELTESSLEKGGKTLTAEDSVHVVAEAHASGGDSQSSTTTMRNVKSAKLSSIFCELQSIGDTDVERKQLKCALLLHPRTYVLNSKEK